LEPQNLRIESALDGLQFSLSELALTTSAATTLDG